MNHYQAIQELNLFQLVISASSIFLIVGAVFFLGPLVPDYIVFLCGLSTAPVIFLLYVSVRDYLINFVEETIEIRQKQKRR